MNGESTGEDMITSIMDGTGMWKITSFVAIGDYWEN